MVSGVLPLSTCDWTTAESATNFGSLLIQRLQLVCMLLALAVGGCDRHLYHHIYLSVYARKHIPLAKHVDDRTQAVYT